MSIHPIRNIVAGTSLDMASDRVVARAAELAARCGARLHLAHGHALPMALYAIARRGSNPVVNAISTIIVAALGVLILISERLRSS